MPVNGGESREEEGVDNNMNKFSRHSRRWHSEHIEMLPNLVNTDSLKLNEKIYHPREKLSSLA